MVTLYLPPNAEQPEARVKPSRGMYSAPAHANEGVGDMSVGSDVVFFH
jgi:hypothetical protein